MKKIYALIPAIIVVMVVAAYLIISSAKPYTVSQDGILYYGARPAANFTISLYNDTETAVIYSIVFWSRDRNIYGLLSLPKNASPPYTAFILLPANSIPKEDEQKWLGADLNKKGYAAFSIDQRGVGTAADVFVNLDYDLGKFVAGGEPENYKMVYDALSAFDVLASQNEINPSSIYMAGESMGGRITIIAGAIEPRIAGVTGISTSGYGLPSEQDYNTMVFIRSIDPDNYVGMISPRKLLLLHSKYDQTISSLQASRTYDYAGEPKLLLLDEGNDHGYYRHEKVITLAEGLQWMLGSQSQSGAQVANPASTYCVEQGGTVRIVDTAEGQAGYCDINGASYDEWEFFRNGSAIGA
jgi:putative hemolysin